MRSLKPVLLTLFIFSLGVAVAQAQGVPQVNFDQTWGYDTGWMNFSISTGPFDSLDLTIEGPAVSQTFKNKLDGWGLNVSLVGQDPGFYRLTLFNNNFSNIQYFTVVNTGGPWRPASFPLSRTYKNVHYTLSAEGSLTAIQGQDSLTLDLGWLKDLARQGATNRTFLYNNMQFVGRWSNPATGYLCEVRFIKTWEGLKQLIYLENPEEIRFTFSLPRAQASINAFRSGCLVWNYRDLLLGLKNWVSVDRSEGLVTLTIPPGSWFLDPTFFTDGFETGDTSNWSEYTGLGGTVNIVTVPALEGSYSLNCSDLIYDGQACVYKSWGGNYKKGNATFLIQFKNSLPDEIVGSPEIIDFCVIRNVAHGAYQDVVRVGIRYNATQNKAVVSRFYNGSLSRIDTEFGVFQLNRTYKMTLLMDIEKNNCVFLVDGERAFNDSYEFGNQELDYGYLGIRAKNSNQRMSVIVDDYKINNDPWIFPSVGQALTVRILDLLDLGISGVNVTIYNDSLKSSALTNSSGYAGPFNVTKSIYGLVIFDGVVSKYYNISITGDMQINKTLARYPLTGFALDQETITVFVWIVLILLGYVVEKWEILVIDSILGIYLAVIGFNASFPWGLFMFSFNLYILFEGLKEAQ